MFVLSSCFLVMNLFSCVKSCACYYPLGIFSKYLGMCFDSVFVGKSGIAAFIMFSK